MPVFKLIKYDVDYNPGGDPKTTPGSIFGPGERTEALQAREQLAKRTGDLIRGDKHRYMGGIALQCKLDQVPRKISVTGGSGFYMAQEAGKPGASMAWEITEDPETGKQSSRRLTAEECADCGFNVPEANTAKPAKPKPKPKPKAEGGDATPPA